MGIIFFKGLTQKLICLRFQKKKRNFILIVFILQKQLSQAGCGHPCVVVIFIHTFFLVLPEVICYMHLKLGIENSVNKMSLSSSQCVTVLKFMITICEIFKFLTEAYLGLRQTYMIYIFEEIATIFQRLTFYAKKALSQMFDAE